MNAGDPILVAPGSFFFTSTDRRPGDRLWLVLGRVQTIRGVRMWLCLSNGRFHQFSHYDIHYYVNRNTIAGWLDG